MTDLFANLPAPKPRHIPSAPTRFLCDLIRLEMRQMTKDQIRQKWKAGEYAGTCPDWAAWNMRGK